MSIEQTADLQSRCELLRSLHRPGDPLLLPNAWDVATARAVVAAGFPVVATTSGGIAATLGYEDHEGAPGDEMGAAGCNLEDSDYTSGSLRDPEKHAEWLAAVRQAASDADYPLVINARVDVFLHPFLGGAGPGSQAELVPDAVRRANTYLDAGVDCVFPIVLWEEDALSRFMSEVRGPVNVVRLPQGPSLAELAALGVARVSWGILLHVEAMHRFAEQLAELRE
jgi:2-methylisocitrate lyase-like PEP mutase family enzyme